MRRVLQRLTELSWRDRWLLARAAAWFCVHRLAMRLVGFKPWHACLRQSAAGLKMDQEVSVCEASRVVWSVQAVRRRLFPRATCLDESMVLERLLCRQGIAARLCIGVRKQTSRLAAHAWVEVHGQVVNDDVQNVSQYLPLANLSPP